MRHQKHGPGFGGYCGTHAAASIPEMLALAITRCLDIIAYATITYAIIVVAIVLSLLKKESP
jgi:hypothetical protein